MSQPYKISVIMPTLNLTLAEKPSIDSILNQTYKNLELSIVVDGGKHTWNPTDTRVKIIRNETNQGIFKSINKGYAYSTGDLITVHDADDLSYSTRFDLLLSVFNPEIGVIGNNLWLIDDSKDRNRANKFDTRRWFRNCLRRNRIGPPPSIIVAV